MICQWKTSPVSLNRHKAFVSKSNIFFPKTCEKRENVETEKSKVGIPLVDQLVGWLVGWETNYILFKRDTSDDEKGPKMAFSENKEKSPMAKYYTKAKQAIINDLGLLDQFL